MVKLMAEKSGLPTIAAIRGVSRSLVKAVTTVAKAAPMTTPTAISTTLPRRMNCLKPLSMEASRGANGAFTLWLDAHLWPPHDAFGGSQAYVSVAAFVI